MSKLVYIYKLSFLNQNSINLLLHFALCVKLVVSVLKPYYYFVLAKRIRMVDSIWPVLKHLVDLAILLQS